VTVEAFGTAPYGEIRSSMMQGLTKAGNSQDMKKAFVAAMAKANDPRVGNDLLDSWSLQSPSVKTEIIYGLLQRPERVRNLLDAIEKGMVKPVELSAQQQSQLRSHRDSAIREQATMVLGRASTVTRQAVVDDFRASLDLRGVAANGRKAFQARCATCHKLGNEGHVLGPDLATVKNAGKEKLLTNILDPNREVNSNYLAYSVETKDGESLVGLIVGESATTVTLRMAGGSESVVPRANIASTQSQGRSLMPESLEEGMTMQDMADLLEFILAP
jgi:putative heme-binding domain-containing protein